jgi:shikimate kinase
VPGARPKAAARRPIVLVGFMASGKSTVGQALAERLSRNFVDTDQLIEQATGRSVTEIFARRGEAEFRELERSLILGLIDDEPRVIAVGGGAFTDPALRSALNRAATTVWLDAPVELILERLAESTDRPLASDKSTEELRRLWSQRRPSYAEAHLRIAVADADPLEVVERVVASVS